MLKKDGDEYKVELSLQDLLESFRWIKDLRDFTQMEGVEDATKALQTALEVLICYLNSCLNSWNACRTIT